MDFQEKVKKVYVADNVRHYILEILDRLRHHQDVQIGPSIRAGIAMLTGARSLAFLNGREFVIPDDVKEVALPVLRHRVKLSADMEIEGYDPDDVLQDVLRGVEAPRL